ncbi:MAG: hypothetical protein QF886_26505, partial [Planctomycetota bacterium]|nr:hypothetical protein [Planctomycetota bacterium]
KKQLINRFNVRLTAQGMMHPVMRLENDPAKNEKAWGNLPWVEGGNAWRRIKPGATTLLVHPSLKTGFGARPVSAVWRCGRGRVLSSALDGTWHWALGRQTEIDYHSRFWGLSIRWLAGDPRLNSGRSLILENSQCEVGKPVSLSLHLKDDAGVPISEAEAEFKIKPPNLAEILATGTSDMSAPGRYTMQFVPTSAGKTSVTCDASLPDGSKDEFEIDFSVELPRDELMRVHPDPAALESLAQASGGASASLAQAGTFEIPHPEMQMTVRHLSIDLWQSKGIAALMIFCLCIEWFFRKRRGLS